MPGGLLEFSEEMELGLKREVKEETNLEITVIESFAVDGTFRYDNFIFDDGRKLNVRFIEIGFICMAESAEVILGEEHSEYRWVTKEELSVSNHGGKIRGGLS